MTKTPETIDVLCVGHASYDLVFSVAHHPEADEKIFAEGFIGCGGGPAANAAVMVAKLGLKAAFAGYLGLDTFGGNHLQELESYNVNTQFTVRGASPTPLSTVLVKPDGKRALVNFKGDTKPLTQGAINFSGCAPKVMLFDGHEPHISPALAEHARQNKIPTVLDAGSVHEGTLALMEHVDYLVASEKFACQYAGDVTTALARLADCAPAVVITLGEKGLVWRRGQEQGAMAAYPVTAIDTTGAGDAFHGAFAAAVALDMEWQALLAYASAAGALCCTKTGARPGLPSPEEHHALIATFSKSMIL